MAKYVDYAGILEFLKKIIEAPIVEAPDYLLGTSTDGKIVRMEQS